MCLKRNARFMETSPGIEKIVKFLSNDLDEAERDSIKAWVNSSKENQFEFDIITHIWASYKKEAKFSINTEHDWKIISARIQKIDAKPIPLWKAVASNGLYRIAAILVIGFATWAIIKPLRLLPSKQIVYVSTQQNELITLEDGSRVWLNQNARLTYPTNFGVQTREVSLEGEAFFDIQKNNKKPFVIHSQNTNTQVLGTSFLVKSKVDSDSISVSVKTGKVLFKSALGEVILTPGEQAYLNKKNYQLNKVNTDLNEMAWHTRELRFDKTNLQDIVRYLRQLYKADIEIDASILKCRFTGFYKDENLEQIIGDIGLALQLKVESNNYKVILHGNGCQ